MMDDNTPGFVPPLTEEEMAKMGHPKQYLVVIDDIYCQNVHVVAFGTETEAEIFRLKCQNINLDASTHTAMDADDAWIQDHLQYHKDRADRYRKEMKERYG